MTKYQFSNSSTKFFFYRYFLYFILMLLHRNDSTEIYFSDISTVEDPGRPDSTFTSVMKLEFPLNQLITIPKVINAGYITNPVKIFLFIYCYTRNKYKQQQNCFSSVIESLKNSLQKPILWIIIFGALHFLSVARSKCICKKGEDGNDDMINDQ